MTTLTDFERDIARDQLNHDERIARSDTIDALLDEIATEIGKIRRIADAVTPDWPCPGMALDLVEAVGRTRQPSGKVAHIANLLGLLQAEAVRWARAHGATVEQISERTGEHQSGLSRRMAGKW